jgi:rhodanese-related sulfurtransferase
MEVLDFMFKKNKLLVLLTVVMIAFALFFVACDKEEKAAAATETKEESASTAEKAPEQEAAPQLDPVEEGVMEYFANKPGHNYKIPEKDFIEKVENGEDMFILDIRQQDVYDEGHAKGAVLASWGPSLGDAFAKIPSGKPVYVYCYSGQTAGQTVMLLNLAGFEAYSVNLGWVYGISRVDGYEAITETAPNDFPAEGSNIHPDILSAIKEYYTGFSDVADTIYKNYMISEDNLKKLIDEDEDVYILSIRSAQHYGEGHIPGASNIPWGAGMEQSFSSLPKDKPIITYCYTGQTAGQTVAGLRLLGYDAVSLRGGIGMPSNAPLGWTNAGYDVVQ